MEPPHDTPIASIIIPAYRAPDYLDVTLRSITPQAAASGAEVIVVSDGPDAANDARRRTSRRAIGHPPGPCGPQYRAQRGDRCRPERSPRVRRSGCGRSGGLAGGGPGRRRGLPRPRGLRRSDPPADGGGAAGLRSRSAADHHARRRARRPRRPLRVGGEHDDAAQRVRPHRDLRSGPSGPGRRGGVAAALHRRGRPDPVPRGGWNRPSPDRRGLAPAHAGEGRLRPGTRGSPSRPPQRQGAPHLRGAAHARRLRLAHRPATLRLRDRHGRPHRRDPARGGCGTPWPEPPDDFLSGTSGQVYGIRATTRAAIADSVADACGDWPLCSRGVSGARRRHTRAGGCWRWPWSATEEPNLLAAARAELLRSRHDVRFDRIGVGNRGKFENLNVLLERHPPQGHDWLLVLDDDVALPRGFLDAFVFLAERFGLRMAQPAHRALSHAAWQVTRRRPGGLVRETSFVEIGPVSRLSRRHLRRTAAVPAAASGLGPGRALGGDRARARLADRRRRRDAHPPSDCAGSRRPTTATRRSPRDGASSPGGRTSPRRRPSGRSPPTGAGDEGPDRRRVLPAGLGPDAGRLGPPPGAGRARRRRRRAGARAAPAAAAAGRGAPAARRRGHARRCPSPAAMYSTGSGSTTCATSPRPGRGATPRGEPGRRRCCGARCAACASSSPFDLVHAHYAVPAGDAVRRAAPQAPLLVSVHGGDVHGGHAGARSVRRTLGHARLVLANSAGTARRCQERGARQTRVVHLGADLPASPRRPRSCRRSSRSAT